MLVRPFFLVTSNCQQKNSNTFEMENSRVASLDSLNFLLFHHVFNSDILEKKGFFQIIYYSIHEALNNQSF